jgi:hypothetical protein
MNSTILLDPMKLIYENRESKSPSTENSPITKNYYSNPHSKLKNNS